MPDMFTPEVYAQVKALVDEVIPPDGGGVYPVWTVSYVEVEVVP